MMNLHLVWKSTCDVRGSGREDLLIFFFFMKMINGLGNWLIEHFNILWLLNRPLKLLNRLGLNFQSAFFVCKLWSDRIVTSDQFFFLHKYVYRTIISMYTRQHGRLPPHAYLNNSSNHLWNGIRDYHYYSFEPQEGIYNCQFLLEGDRKDTRGIALVVVGI